MEAFPYSLALELNCVLILWIGLSIWQRDRGAPGGRWFVALIAAVLIWSVGELLFVRGLLTPWQCAAVTYLGICTAAPFLLGLAAHAAAAPLVRRVPWFPLALCVPGLFVYSFLFLGPWSGLFIVVHGGAASHGPLFWIYLLYSYALALICVALLARAAMRWPREGLTPRVVALCLSILVPLVGNLAYLRFYQFFPLDPTPLLMGAAAVALRAAVFRGGLLDVLPIGDQSLVEHLPVGLLLADDCGGVIEVNPAALDWLGMSREQALGRSLDALLATLPPGVDVHTTRFALSRRHDLICAVLTEEHSTLPMRAVGLG